MTAFGPESMSALALGRRDRARRPRLGLAATAGRERFIEICALGAAALLFWAGVATVDQVVSAQGEVALTQKNQLVQHLEGGILEEILVAEGDTVTRGQPLVVVRDSRWEAAAERADLERLSLRAKIARLSAEAGGLERIEPPEDIALTEAIAVERRIFEQRRGRLDASVAVLREQLAKSELELDALKKRAELLQIEREFIAEKAERLSSMAAKGAVSRNDQLTALIELQRLETQLVEMRYQTPQLEASVSEARNQITVEILRHRSEAREAMAETQLKLDQIDAEIRALRDRAARAIVAAPTAGVINTLFVTTPGGVVREGQTIAEIVPAGQALRVEVEASPEDRARIAVGMPATVKVSAYDFGQYGGVGGKVAEISADTVSDDRGRRFFRVAITLESDVVGGGGEILPGMSVDVDIIGEPRTVLSLVTRPITKTLDRALK